MPFGTSSEFRRGSINTISMGLRSMSAWTRVGAVGAVLLTGFALMSGTSNSPANPSELTKKSAPTAVPVCLQWLAGNCVLWDGAAPSPPAPERSGKDNKNSGSEGTGYSGGDESSRSSHSSNPKPHYVAPCDSTACCQHFWQGNKDVGLDTMFDPSCELFSGHADCIAGFKCSYCCDKPLNGCPMKQRVCREITKKEFAKYKQEAAKEGAEEKRAAAKVKAEKARENAKEERIKTSEEKTKKEAKARDKVSEEKVKANEKKAKQPGKTTKNGTTKKVEHAAPTPEPTPPYVVDHRGEAPCHSDECCDSFWKGSTYDNSCAPGHDGHPGCIGGFACAYELTHRPTADSTKKLEVSKKPKPTKKSKEPAEKHTSDMRSKTIEAATAYYANIAAAAKFRPIYKARAH